MKITKLSTDTLAVSALVAAAETVQNELVARNVGVAVVDAAGVLDVPTLVVYSLRDEERDRWPRLAVTVEPSPRVLLLEDGDG